MTAAPDASRSRSSSTIGDEPSLRAAVHLVSEVRDRWRRGEPPDAAAVLAQHPELMAHQTIVVKLATAEYRQRTQAGEAVDSATFSGRFPVCQGRILQLIELDKMLDHDPRFRAQDETAGWPKPGESFLGFQLIEELGRGAFAHVYLAREPALGNRQVAVKVAVHGGQEAEVLGRLQHPNIVPVYSVQQDPETFLTAFCMPYRGRAVVSDVLDRVFAGPGPPKRARAILDAIRAANDKIDSSKASMPHPILRSGTYVEGVAYLGMQLAEALVHAHSQGVCHRDLKPSNVLLSPEGEPLLLDFNASADDSLPPDRLGGTLAYMAPEQLAFLADEQEDLCGLGYEPRSDLFSLGLILYELLAGVRPFTMPSGQTGREVAAELRQRQKRSPRPLAEYNRLVDPAIARLVEACLAFDPQERPQKAGEIAAALRGEFALSRRAHRWARNHRPALAAASALLSAFVTALVVALAIRAPYSVREYQRGLDYYGGGEYQRAVDSFNESLKSNPQQSNVLFARGRALQQLGDYRMAFEDYRAAQKLAADPRAYAGEGYCLSRLGQHTQAVAFYRKAIANGYSSPGLLNNIGFDLFQLAQLDESKEYLEQAIQQDEFLGAAYHNLLLVHLRRAHRGTPVPKEVLRQAERATAIGPPSADLYRDAAAFWAMAAGRDSTLIPRAIQYLEKALAYGLDSRTLQTGPVFATLRSNPAFQKMASKAAQSLPATKANHFVDPL